MTTLTSKKVYLPVLLLVLLTTAGCTYLFFKPDKDFIHDSDTLKLSPADVTFTSSDGVRLHGWYLRAEENRGTILVCHGNVENLSTHVKLDLWLVEEGYNLFIFDYRGYGKSEGVPTIDGVHRDAAAALEKVLALSGDDRIIVFGKSLGGAIAVYTVARSTQRGRVKALIIDSAFSSYRRIAREKIAARIIGWPVQYPLSLLVNNDYSPERWIGQVSPVPVLILHGKRDALVPYRHGQRLYNAAVAPKVFWEVSTPGHVKAQADKKIRKRLLEYLASLAQSER